MRRDTIFYKLFQQSPTLLFELLSQPPNRANEYIFDSILPIGLGLMVLTTLEGDVAVESARQTIERSRSLNDSRVIIELVSTILVYKFKNLTRDEVDAMLGIVFEDTRVYQEARAEGEVRGLERGQQQEKAFVLRLLARKLGNLKPEIQTRVNSLTIEQIESLGEALLDFNEMGDLLKWLDINM